MVDESSDEKAAHWDPVQIDGRFCLLTSEDARCFAARFGASWMPARWLGSRRPSGWVVAGVDELAASGRLPTVHWGHSTLLLPWLVSR